MTWHGLCIGTDPLRKDQNVALLYVHSVRHARTSVIGSGTSTKLLVISSQDACKPCCNAILGRLAPQVVLLSVSCPSPPTENQI